MKTAICIPVYNEQENINELLREVTTIDGIDHIIIISSSKDNTDKIVKDLAAKDSRIQLIHEDKRGKTLAMNMALRVCDILKVERAVFIGGDNLPINNSLQDMLDYPVDDTEGLVGVRQIPIDKTDNMWGFLSHLQWNIHHNVSLVHPKLSGELFLMKVGVLRELPPAIINDDLYIQHIFGMHGYKTVYLPNAGVALKGTQGFKDFIKQRLRVYIGHHQLRLLLGKSEPTKPSSSLKVLSKSMPYKGWKGLEYTLLFVALQGICFVGGFVLFHFGYLPYRWSSPETTKVLRYGV